MKSKHRKILAVLGVLTIIKIIICSLLPMFYIEGFVYDDFLMVKLSENIENGNWLGNYTEFTLVKGMFFPLLLSFFRLIHLPAGIGISIIYILACITFCYVIRNLFKNKNILYILYILLLFNPITFSSETFERLYRYIIGPAQILFLLSFLYGIYKNIPNIKKIIPHLIGLGITCATIMLTREDYLFMNALLLICFIIFIIKLKKRAFILVIPIIIIVTITSIPKIINHKYYGQFITNELTESNFKDAYISILSVKPKEYKYRASVTKDTLNEIFKISPTLSKFKPEIENFYKDDELVDGEVIDGYMFWMMRSIFRYHPEYKSSKEINEFWKQVDKEIQTAFKNGKLEKRFTFSTIYISPPTSQNIIKTIEILPKTINYILTYDEVMTFDYNNLKQSNNAQIYTIPKGLWNYSEYKSLLIQDRNITAHVGTLSYKEVGGVCNSITLVYKDLSLIINILGLLSFITLIIKKQFKNLFLPTITFICLSLIIAGVTYTDASAFDAIRYFYLAPVYILLIVFSTISIGLLVEGVQNGEIRFNNINAMFKRRRKHKHLYSKRKTISK